MARLTPTREETDPPQGGRFRRGRTGAYPSGGQPAGRSRAAPRLALRLTGALALLAMAAVHLEQFFGAHYADIRTIGTLFALNFVGGTLIALGLIGPIERIAGRWGVPLVMLLALAGIAVAATSFAFLLISESTPLFGFMESGYRLAVVVALVAEGAAVLLLSSYLASGRPGRVGR